MGIGDEGRECRFSVVLKEILWTVADGLNFGRFGTMQDPLRNFSNGLTPIGA